MDPQNLMTTLQQLSNLSGANLTSQIALNQFGNDLSSLPWTSGPQAWLDSAKMAAMYNLIQTASVNDQVQQLNTINAMNTIEQSLKLMAQQSTSSSIPQQSQTTMANTQSTLQSQLETMLQNEALSSFLQQQQQVSTASTSKETANNLAQLLQLSQQSNTNDFLASNLQSILGLATSSAPVSTTSSALPTTTTEQDLFNAAANHFNSIHTADPLQNLYSKPAKKQSKEHNKKHSIDPDQRPSSSQQLPNEAANHATLLTKISQNNLLNADSNFGHVQLPSTSASIPSVTNQQNGMEDFDLNALHEMLFDKSRQKEPAKQPIIQHPAPKTSASNTQHLQKHHETDKDLDHFASMMENAGFDFDFNEAAEHAEKSFDPLKFLMSSMNAGPARDSPEPNQAELEPVQFTPPDSPQNHLKMDHAPSISVNANNKHNLMAKQQEVQKLNGSVHLDRTAKSTKNDDLLVFIPPVPTSAPVKKASVLSTVKKSSLLQSVNKVPIYKQKFITTSASTIGTDTKNDDCYSFVDDEFDLPAALKAPTTSTQKEQEAAQPTRTNERPERQSTNASIRKLPQIKDVREPRSFAGTSWTKEFLERTEQDQLWMSVNPFECTEIQTDEAPHELAWTSEPFKKKSIRVVIKEEPVAANPTEETPRPRLVLKFIKPKADELENEEPSTSENHRSHHHSKKHKKHKKRDRDTDYEYPGQQKRHKKKHHHKNRHRDKSETFDENDELHPAYNTRSLISVKTENLEYTSPAHSSHSHISIKNESIGSSNHKSSSVADVPLLIGSRLNEQFIKRYRSFAQTQNDLPKGVFVVAKEDVWKEDCSLWRIDSQNLLQKFVACDENPGCYTNTSNFTGWCDEIADQYVIIHVEILKQTRAETIVKPFYPLDTLFPALPNEDASIFCVEEDESEMQVDLDATPNDQVLIIEMVVELLQRQCAHSSTLEDAYNSPESKTTRALREFQRRCLECTEELQIEETIRPDVCILLDHYHGLITFPSSSPNEDECLCCGQSDEYMFRVGLHGGEKYDPELLTIQKIDNEAFGHAMDIAACSQCVEQLKFYHQNRHAFFNLYKRCENQFIDLALERPTASANALLNLALKDREFARITANEISQIWSKLPTIMSEE